MAKPIETWSGSRVVYTYYENGKYRSRLYVNYGETATLTHATHKTRKGVSNWCYKVLTR